MYLLESFPQPHTDLPYPTSIHFLSKTPFLLQHFAAPPFTLKKPNSLSIYPGITDWSECASPTAHIFVPTSSSLQGCYLGHDCLHSGIQLYIYIYIYRHTYIYMQWFYRDNYILPDIWFFPHVFFPITFPLFSYLPSFSYFPSSLYFSVSLFLLFRRLFLSFFLFSCWFSPSPGSANWVKYIYTLF